MLRLHSLQANEVLEVVRGDAVTGDSVGQVVNDGLLVLGAHILDVHWVAGGLVEPHPRLVGGVLPEGEQLGLVGSEGVGDEALSHIEEVVVVVGDNSRLDGCVDNGGSADLAHARESLASASGPLVIEGE
jgi:hypothetical protein